MRTFWLDDETETETDEIPHSVLAREGVFYTRIEPGVHEEALRDVMALRGYRTQDEVHLHPETEGLDAILARFDKEHLHRDDEVRYVLEGAGVFDIRARDDRWMRLVVVTGDLIVVPRGMHHRFTLTEARMIRARRLFEDEAGWVPHYRER